MVNKARFKLPRELPFDGQVKGNNIAVGFTDGTNTNTIYRSTSNGNAYSPSSTGVGGQIATSTGGGGGTVTVQKTLGITTDPTKSGIILNRDNTEYVKYLFFFIN